MKACQRTLQLSEMPVGIRIDDVDCRECDSAEVYMDLKEEPMLYKIGAQCSGCGHDYGVLDRIPRTKVDHVDEVYDLGEDRVRSILER